MARAPPPTYLTSLCSSRIAGLGATDVDSQVEMKWEEDKKAEGAHSLHTVKHWYQDAGLLGPGRLRPGKALRHTQWSTPFLHVQGI